MRHIFDRRRGARPLLKLLLLAALPLAGCGDLLEVEDVDVTTQDAFVDETTIPSLHAAAYADFVTAYESMVLYTGLLADEWAHSGTFTTRAEVDRRNIDRANATMSTQYTNVQRARAIADFVDDRLGTVDPDSTASSLRAEVRALSGHSLLLMVNAYCEGTPMSRLEGEEFIYGPPLTRVEVLDSATARFNATLDLAASGSDQAYLAQVGLARVLLHEGDYDGAAAAVAGIPTTWTFLAYHSTEAGQANTVWNFNISQERWTATDTEGGNGLPYLTSGDPRLLALRSGGTDVGFDRGTPQYDVWKFPAREANIVVASGVEARLIEAEAALQTDPDAMLTILNDLRADLDELMPLRSFDWAARTTALGASQSLPALSLPATLDEQVDLLFQERAYWLWMEARRLGDLRRMIRQYGRAATDLFPVGTYAPNGNVKSGAYGTDVNFPIPIQEDNNPVQGAGQCLNRDA